MWLLSSWTFDPHFYWSVLSKYWWLGWERAPRVGVSWDRAITEFLFCASLIAQNYGFPLSAPEWPLTGTNGWVWVWFWKQGLVFWWECSIALGSKSRIFSSLWCTQGCSPPWGVWDAGARRVRGGSRAGRFPVRQWGALLCAQLWGPLSQEPFVFPIPPQDTAPGIALLLAAGEQSLPGSTISGGDLCWAPWAKFAFQCLEKQENIQVFHMVNRQEI